MSKLSKDTQQRIVISLTSEPAGKELIDAIESATTGSGDEYALSNLSNLTGTAIPAGVNIESLSTIQSQVSGFLIKTINQTTSVSGSVAINSGTTTGAFSSGFVNLVSGSSSNADGALSTTRMTGDALLSSGSIIGGTRGSSGSASVRSGGVAVISSAGTYTGNTGLVSVIAGTVQSSFNGAIVTGNSGVASLGSGGIFATVSGATATGNSGNVLVSSGTFFSSVVGAVVSGNSGSVSLQSGGVSGVGTSTVTTGASTLTTGGVTNANNVGSTGTASMSTGQNAGIGNSGSVSISTGNVTNPLTSSINFSGAISAITGKSIRATSGPIILQTGEISPFGFNNESNTSSFTGVFSVTTGAINSALNTGSTGDVLLFSGSHNGLGNTGVVAISSGSQLGSGNSGSVNISSGSAGIGNSGDLSIYSGSASNTSGNVLISTGASSSGATRGGISLSAQNTTVFLTTIAASGVNSIFNVQNTAGASSFQVLHDAEESNNSVGIRIFEGSPTNGFSINGWGQLNQNGGPFNFRSTKSYTSTGGSFSGGDFNIVAHSTDYIDPSVNSEISSGNVNISTENAYISGSGANANTGSINLTTGTPQGTGTRGNIVLNSPVVVANVTERFQIQTPSTGASIQMGLTSYGQLGGPYMYIIGLANDRTFEIGGQGGMNNTPGLTEVHGASVVSDTDGNYTSGKLILRTKPDTGGNYSDHVSYNSGDVELFTGDAFVKGSLYPDANTGNVNIYTGTPAGTGTRGHVSINGDYITVNSNQIKNLTDATDPQDAVSLSQLNAKTRAGSVSIPNASNTVTVTFSSDIGTSNYSVNLQIQNTIDASPLFLDKIITSQSSTGFTVKFSQNTDSANYNLQYVAQLFN
jgi:hypothetical protein